MGTQPRGVGHGGFRLDLREEARDWQSFGDRFTALEDNIEKVVRGKHAQIRLALVGLVAEGHLLIEDVPGVGKTMLAKALARSIDCSFRRIQFTPDMLPDRHHRRERVQPGARRFRVPPRRGVRERRARR